MWCSGIRRLRDIVEILVRLMGMSMRDCHGRMVEDLEVAMMQDQEGWAQDKLEVVAQLEEGV